MQRDSVDCDVQDRTCSDHDLQQCSMVRICVRGNARVRDMHTMLLLNSDLRTVSDCKHLSFFRPALHMCEAAHFGLDQFLRKYVRQQRAHHIFAASLNDILPAIVRVTF